MAITGVILLIPAIAMQFTDEVKWTLFDFAAMGALLFGSGVAYKLIAARSCESTYRIAVGIAVLASLLLLWMNAAVGLIGSEDNPVNLMFLSVPAVGMLGTLLSKFRPRGMMLTAFAMAAVQFAIPVIAMVINRPEFSLGVVQVLLLNSCFVMAFLFSSLLFRRSAAKLEESPDR